MRLVFNAFGLVTVLVLLSSLVCDLFWDKRADIVAISVFLAVLSGTVIRYTKKAMQPPLS